MWDSRKSHSVRMLLSLLLLPQQEPCRNLCPYGQQFEVNWRPL